MASWAYVKHTSTLYEIFGSNPVPIESIVPGVPREKGCPLCYWIMVDKLDQQVLAALAERLYHQWQPECSSVEESYEYILKGLPLRTSHFFGVGTDDYFMIPWGAALSLSAHLQEEE